MVYCPECGAEVSEGVKFCSECGNSLEEPSVDSGSSHGGGDTGSSATAESSTEGTTPSGSGSATGGAAATTTTSEDRAATADGATTTTTSERGAVTDDTTATTASSTSGTARTAAEPEDQETSLDLPANQAAALSYVFGLITGLIVFLIEDENEFARFHAAQSIVLSLAFGGVYLIFGVLTNVLFFLPDVIGVLLVSLLGLVQAVIGLVGLVAWVYLIIQAYQGERFVAPVIGGFAENLANQG